MLALLGEILATVLEVLGILQMLRGILGDTAQEDTLNVVETIAATGTNAVTNPISGVQPIWALIGALQSGAEPSLATITDLIDALTPTTLPPEQPPGWPGETAGSLLGWPMNEPWWGAYEQVRQVQQVWYDTATQLLGMTQAEGWPDRHGPWFALTAYAPDIGWEVVKPWRVGGPLLPPVEVDWATWDGEQTLVQFLNATWPEYLWDHTGPGSYQTPGIVWGHITGEAAVRWRCLVAEWQLPWVSGRAWSALAKLTDGLPPMWPGLAGVSLGTPVELTESGIITAEMDGILVDVTANKAGAGGFGTNGAQYTWRGGWMTFLDATGRAEPYQFMGWASAFYLPKQMAHANGACLVLRDILACTVTPFTIL